MLKHNVNTCEHVTQTCELPYILAIFLLHGLHDLSIVSTIIISDLFRYFQIFSEISDIFRYFQTLPGKTIPTWIEMATHEFSWHFRTSWLFSFANNFRFEIFRWHFAVVQFFMHRARPFFLSSFLSRCHLLLHFLLWFLLNVLLVYSQQPRKPNDGVSTFAFFFR